MRDWEGSLPDFSFQCFLSNTVHLSSIVSGALGQIEGHPQRFFGEVIHTDSQEFEQPEEIWGGIQRRDAEAAEERRVIMNSLRTSALQ
jgi:hypothetical protein